ncbi:Crp/Fnr family transcriptional regulator [Hydrogenimonas thermophila]|uniref:Crp/Fnr family transcriptional regulator n=1 Tax=Hydrogenimonas thermophila TaxID=223786 RepID=UPI0029371DAA|nr:Crp/Fnr family transcriptional regulator [Hydrogenimonas thermophila]WOE70206.1 Crp/Fnr family transcriptional regulator [Hydrogenimonas thermophila]WOE72723.1 Crp/Fnr family transcriptional regulator [Hydrogenimonas thermophila]
MMKLDIELLKSIPIFNKLNSNELLSLQEISSIKRLKKEEVLFYEGDESKTLHIIIDGEIEVYKVNSKGKEIILKKFIPFSFIAEVSNYNGINFPASAKATCPSTVLLINFKEFEKKFLFHPTIAPVILKSMANKVMNLEKVISNNLILDASQRVAKFIYDNEECLNKIKHHKIAEYLNITPVTLSRILKRFKDEKLIETHNNKFTANRERLKKEFS